MQAIFKRTGGIAYTPIGAVVAGLVVVIGKLIGIATRPIAAGVEGNLETEGVFTVVKATGAIAQGDKVFWNVDGDPVGGTQGTGAATKTSTSNILMGVAVAGAASEDETVDLELGSSSANYPT